MDESNHWRPLGEAIRDRRRELGWTQEELAARASTVPGEVRQSDVSRLERGKVTLPRRERLEHMAAVLGLSLGDLLARSGWTGADSAFAAERPSHTARQDRQLDRLPIVAESPRQGSPDQSAVISRNLRRLIEQAHKTRSRTREVLRKCEETRTLYEQPRRNAAIDPHPNTRIEITYPATDRRDGGDR